MRTHQLIITLGSNTGSASPLDLALSELRQSLTISSLSPLMQTEAVDFAYPSPPFLNRLIVASTTLSYEAMLCECKRIEQLCGRSEQQRATTPQIIPLDLDIIVWGSTICKPQDLSRPYVLQGLASLAPEK